MTTKNMAIVSLVCGIVGIVGSFIPYVSYIAPLCAIAGIVFGALALKNVKAGNPSLRAPTECRESRFSFTKPVWSLRCSSR